MINIILSGCNGRMGKTVAALAANSPNAVITAGIDFVLTPNSDFPVYGTIAEYSGAADVVVDFTQSSSSDPNRPPSIDSVLPYCIERRLPIVLATTGYDDAQLESIGAAAEKIAIFRSANMSLGISLLTDLVRRAARVLEGYDIEIIEKHHNQKLDAPSGTALMLADAAAAASGGDKKYVYDRHPVRKLREKSEIGISAVRGGTIIGEHEVLFAGFNELITVSHSAQSRELFAAGALRAAEFMCGKPAGQYNMDDLVSSL